VGELNLLDLYPRSKRPIEERGELINDEHRRVARQFGPEFFDGDRLYGYGGYMYHPRFWQATVRRFRDHYKLEADARVLDIGCAKGFMLHDFRELMPHSTVAGVDLSEYAVQHAMPTVRPFIRLGNARELPYDDGAFDLVVCITTIHNLPLDECKQAVGEIQRVTRHHAFLTVDAWRTEAERQRMLKWNLTAVTYMHVDAWTELFNAVGYRGDYYWFLAE